MPGFDVRPQSIRLCEHDARSAFFGLFRRLMGHHDEEITAKCGNIVLLRVSRGLDQPRPSCYVVRVRATNRRRHNMTVEILNYATQERRTITAPTLEEI